MSNLGFAIAILIVLVIIGWILIRLFSSAFIKTTPTAAFVRTGGLRRGNTTQPLVVMNGAAWVFNFLHRIKWVSLETMALEVRHTDDRALVSNDPQYVDLEARFFVKVGDSVAEVGIAARTIGGDLVDEASIRRMAEPKINGAVRDIAAMFSLKDLLEKRIDFIRQIKERIAADLAGNGLVLESISILTLRPTLMGHYSTEDLLGAQVARANSAVIEQALTEKNRLENDGALQRARLNALAERERLGIEEEIERERAQRAKNIALVRATEDAEAKIMQEQKREEAERTRIMTERALQAESIENERQEVMLREQLQKAGETERVLREQAVALAEQQREKEIALAMAEKLAAIRTQIEADSQREQALQEATTLAEKAEAMRDAEIDLINARLEADKLALENSSKIEMEAVRLKQMAEAEREAAIAQAERQRILSESELEAAKLAAIGDRERGSAAGLAEVQVALERIKVMEAEADAIRKRLLSEAEGDRAKFEALAGNQALGQQLELAKLEADMQRQIEVAKAEALGKAINGMKMNLYGDSAMANRLLGLITTAQSAQHVFDALPNGAQKTIRSLAGKIAGDGNGSDGSLIELLDVIQRKHADALEGNATLGEVSRALLDDSDIPAAQRDLLRSVADNDQLRDLPFGATRALIEMLSS